VVVSRRFIAEHDEVATVLCAPIYSSVLGLPTEVVVDSAVGIPRESAIRCDFLMLMFKSRLTKFVAKLPAAKVEELDRALAIALDLKP
jgi:mRNA-degrading endonuclease toxin of MazEF toxin-antitoxin module